MDVERLTALVRERSPCVVLTGAGVSTESGIPDFRSRTGIWADVDPFEVATIDAFRREPARVWEFYARRLATLDDAEPNEGHRALAELEQRGIVSAVVTQNVDGLHRRAGSRAVVEVHGSIRRAVCLDCGEEEPIERAREALGVGGLPRCAGCDAVLKPGVVLFGELLPADAIRRAEELARAAPLVLVVGSSLEVWPVAGLPLLAATLAIVNRGPTALDEHAAVRVDAGAGETLAALAAALS